MMRLQLRVQNRAEHSGEFCREGRNRELRRCKEIKVSSLLLRGWFDQVIPLAVELVSLQIDLLHLLVGHFAPDRIFSSIQSARNLQALRRRRRSNQVDDRLIVPQWLTAPIG